MYPYWRNFTLPIVFLLCVNSLIIYAPTLKLSAMTEGPNVGLQNDGSTCFAIASLQCLTHAYPFMKFIHDHPDYRPPGSVQDEFYNFACAMYHGQSNDGSYNAKRGAARKLRDYVAEKIPNAAHLGGNDQKDAYEFINFIIDALLSDTLYHKAISTDIAPTFDPPDKEKAVRRIVSNYFVPFCSSYHEPTPENLSLWYDKYTADYYQPLIKLNDLTRSPIWDSLRPHLLTLKNFLSIFCFTWQNTITCPPPCNDKSKNLDFATSVQAALKVITSTDTTPKDAPQGALLQDLLTCYFQTETLIPGNERFCQKCRKFTLASTELKINSLPIILSILLKRFDFSTMPPKKVDTSIVIPVTLTLDEEWVSEEYKQYAHPGTPDLTYHLFGVVLHSGTLRGGHYTAIARKQGDKWYYYNDSADPELLSSTQLQAHLTSSNPYLLFYEQDRSWTSPREFIPRETIPPLPRKPDKPALSIPPAPKQSLDTLSVLLHKAAQNAQTLLSQVCTLHRKTEMSEIAVREEFPSVRFIREKN